MVEKINIVVNGATGKMGLQTLVTLGENAELFTVVGANSPSITDQFIEQNNLNQKIVVSKSFSDLLGSTSPDLCIDFSVRESAMESAVLCAQNGVDFITGTSGLNDDDVVALKALSAEQSIGIFVGPNFSLGAIVLQHIASIVGRHFDTADIIEMHHAEKLDAPSGSAIATAKDMIEAKGTAFDSNKTEKFNLKGSRGANLSGISLHSLRLPGLMARQEVVLGGKGEMLNLSHTTLNRESYMPGLLLAIEYISNNKDFTFGLGSILDL